MVERSLFFDIRHDPQANTELNRTRTQFKYIENKIEPLTSFLLGPEIYFGDGKPIGWALITVLLLAESTCCIMHLRDNF
jgi:hypothetical protein